MSDDLSKVKLADGLRETLDAAAQQGGGIPEESGPAPESTPEQVREDQAKTVERNSPNRDRTEHLINVGRADQTSGRM